MFDPKDVTIGQYADYLVFDPDGLSGEPRYEVCGEKRPLAEGYAMFFSLVGPTVAEMLKRPENGQK